MNDQEQLRMQVLQETHDQQVARIVQLEQINERLNGENEALNVRIRRLETQLEKSNAWIEDLTKENHRPSLEIIGLKADLSRARSVKGSTSAPGA